MKDKERVGLGRGGGGRRVGWGGGGSSNGESERVSD